MTCVLLPAEMGNSTMMYFAENETYSANSQKNIFWWVGKEQNGKLTSYLQPPLH